MRRYQILIACVCLASLYATVGQAADRTADQASIPGLDATNQNYRAPQGFGAYAWHTPLGKFDRLVSEPVYVRVAHSIGKVTSFDFNCYEAISGSDIRNNKLPDHHALGMKACRETDGDGFHAMAEYFVDSQGYRVRSEDGGKAVLFPITYQFCAHWKGFTNEFKGDPLEQMQLCGVRFHFRSESFVEEAANRELTHITSYERVLNWLLKEHGEPEDYKREGEVLIPQYLQEQPREKLSSKDRYISWSWCRPHKEELKPKCTASIVLNFDRSTGRGQVIYLTPAVWAYAYARQFGGSEGDPLYRVLHGGMTQSRVQHQCMDSFLCRPSRPGAMPEKLLARFRLQNKTEAN